MKRFALALLFTLLPSLAFGQANWGDYSTGATIARLVNTVGSDGVATTITSEDVLVVKDGATVLTAGITIDDDVSLDFGGGAATKAGLHKITIVLTTSGYDDGDYEVVFKDGDVGAIAVDRRILAGFSIGRFGSFDDDLPTPTAPPGATPTIQEALAWLSWLSQARATTDNGTDLRTVFGADGTTPISEEVLDDDGTTFDKGEAEAP